MQTLHKFLAFWIIGVSLFGVTAGTKCYQCGQTLDTAANCLDDYNLDSSVHIVKDCGDSEVPGCLKSKFVDDKNRHIVTRGCAPEDGMRHKTNECKSTEVDNHKVYFCHCTGDFCNTSSHHPLSFTLILTAIAIWKLVLAL
ncbi:hypothetical protein EB796_007759 [Bugula neritina]|uniref:Protein sleepless n=1 Tax=Bugula neritina TaxID=10212 RepID=A0A7J7K5L9_BUGNE|nr:hypothetical protein EB796_007759 [Bugula neritina]